MENFRTYKIVTNRLILRCYEPQDVPAMSEGIMKSREHLGTFMPWAINDEHDTETVLKRIRKFRGLFDSGKDYIMGIFDKESGAYLGGAGWHLRVGDHAAEIGYWVMVDHTQKGIATEAARALTKVGFEIEDLERIQIHTQVQNEVSARIPERLGYVKEARLRKRITTTSGEAADIFVFSMLRDEYRGSEIAQMEVQAYDFIGRPLFVPFTP